MPQFYFIRHGQKEYQHDESPLTRLGHEQAHKTAAFLKQFPISHIYVSPLLRAVQTAAYIEEALALTATHHHHLKQLAEERSDFPAQQFFPSLGVQEHDHVALISHSPVIRHFIRTTFSTEELQQKSAHFSLTGEIKLPECSVTIFSWEKMTFTLHELGKNEHLRDR